MGFNARSEPRDEALTILLVVTPNHISNAFLFIFFSLTGDSSVALQAQEEIIEMKDVFSVKLKRRRFAGQKKGGTLLGITIFKCLNKEENKLTDCAIHLNNLSEDHCQSWFRHLKEILNGKHLIEVDVTFISIGNT